MLPVGELPEIGWETTKVVDGAAEGDASAGAAAESRTAVKEKKAKAPRLDVFDRSAASRKPVFLYFTAKECAACRTMEKLMLRQKAVVEKAKDFHAVVIGTDFVDRALLDAYKVKEAPTILLCDYDGKPRLRLVGRQSNKTVEAAFRQAVKKNGVKAAAAARKAAEGKVESTAGSAEKKGAGDDAPRKPGEVGSTKAPPEGTDGSSPGRAGEEPEEKAAGPERQPSRGQDGASQPGR